MKMNMKKILCMALVSTMTAGCLAGCGGKSKKEEGGDNVIEIYMQSAGYGTEYVEKIKDAFAEEHPEYTIKITSSTEQRSASFGLPDVDTYDLYISTYNMEIQYLEPLDDVLEYTVPGESMKIGDKFSQNYLDTEVFADGHYYNLTQGLGGATGFVYSKSLFEEAGIHQLPRTSDELAVVCDTLMENDITPMCSFKNGGYWSYIGEAWFLQYDGWDYYRNTFYANKDEDGTSPSIDVFKKKDGRYKTLKALEKIVTPAYMLAGSSSTDHISVQTQFLNGKAAIMLNGQWLEHEMSSVGSVDDFAMMKMPVISSITEKLDTVKTETGLRQLISAIDAVVDGDKTIEEYVQGDHYEVNGTEVSSHDWEYVKLARYTVGSSNTGSGMYIPNYSDAIEGSKEFLKFWYSEKSAEILSNLLNCPVDFATEETKIDDSDWTPYEQSVADIAADVLQSGSQFMKNEHAIFHYGGAISYGKQIGTYLQYFCAANPNDRIDADGAWKQIEEYIDQNYENSWLANIK